LDPEGSVAGVGELRSVRLRVSRTQAGKEHPTKETIIHF